MYKKIKQRLMSINQKTKLFMVMNSEFQFIIT